MQFHKVLTSLLLLFLSFSALGAEENKELNLNETLSPTEKVIDNSSDLKTEEQKESPQTQVTVEESKELNLNKALPQEEVVIAGPINSGNTNSAQAHTILYIKTPYIKDILAPKDVFFQTNIGVGFLYFSKVRGNLMGRPVNNFAPATQWRDVPYKRGLSYNRTPLFEYLLGYQVNSSFKVALSYQYQGGITVKTAVLPSYVSGNNSTNMAQLKSNLSLNAFLLKFYFEFPKAFVWRKLAIAHYLAAGVGPGWQSWTRIQMHYLGGNTAFIGSNFVLSQRLIASAVWMFDLGFRIQGTLPSTTFSVLVGCKYNQWGQARNIGKMSKQGSLKWSLTQPFRIKTVYQFAPYLGVQWNFPNTYTPCSYTDRGKVMAPRIPYFSSTNTFQSAKAFWTQFNVGLGLLYFSGVRANFAGKPNQFFTPATQWRDVPFKGRLIYNQTPLLEYLIGYRLNSWFKLALSYQYQGGVTVRSKSLWAYPPAGGSDSDKADFTSNLSLNGILCKFYFELPYAMVLKSLSMSPYLAVGVGPGWQSWTRSLVNYTRGNTAVQMSPLPLRQTFSASAIWMVDMGFRIQGMNPNSNFSALMGCKYNQWGQARNIGKFSRQGSLKSSPNQPLRVKTVYQFAPYLGVQWNFPSAFSSSYCLKGKNPNVWLPYFTRTSNFQCPRAIWTQFNVGAGFLYFSGIHGNLMGRPVSNFSPAGQWRDAPIKGRLKYNATPLFEYLLGYQCSLWAKIALSYQHQGGVAVETKVLESFPAINLRIEGIQLVSNLSLNSILFKLYFEIPHAMIFKNLAISPYFAVGVGPGWQSWTNIEVNYIVNNTGWVNHVLPLRQKISANAVWMIDKGFRIQSAYPNSSFSVLVGGKYNQWGQARSIGKMSQKGSYKISLTQPFRVKTVYQFAPYLGVQWQF